MAVSPEEANDFLKRVIKARHLWSAEYGGDQFQNVPTLFHYTSAEGLKGILESSSIYGSHINYLNDTSEAEHAISFGQKLLNDLPADSTEPSSGLLGRRLAEYGKFFFDRPNNLWRADDAYVTSFCESGDLLSQWRAYGLAFAIGFAPADHAGFSVLQAQGIWKNTLAKVLYRDDE